MLFLVYVLISSFCKIVDSVLMNVLLFCEDFSGYCSLMIGLIGCVLFSGV